MTATIIPFPKVKPDDGSPESELQKLALLLVKKVRVRTGKVVTYEEVLVTCRHALAQVKAENSLS